jgi:PAS domain S-box-containing protein
MGWELMRILNEPGNLKDSLRLIISELKTRTGFDAVGIRLQDGNDYPYFEQQGFPEDFLLTENTLVKRAENGMICRNKDGNINLECTCGMVISGVDDPENPLFTKGGSIWENDSSKFLDIPASKDPRIHPRNNCTHRGYSSIAIVPIRNNSRIVGIFQFNDRRKGSFSPYAIEALEEIASHIGAPLVRKQTEVELQEIMDRYQAVVEDQTEIICRYKPDGTYVFVNEAFCNFFGKSRAELLGKAWFPEGHPEDREMILQKLKGLSPDNSVIIIENRVYSGNGDLHWVQFINRGLFDRQGKLFEVQSIGRDITERKNAEDLLVQTRLNHETFFNTIDDFLFVLNEHGNIIHTNTKVNNNLGYTKDEILGNSILMVLPPEHHDDYGKIVSKILNGKAVNYNIPIVTKSGTQIPVEIKINNGIWNNQPVLFGVAKDISRISISEEKFSKVFHINPSACGLSNLNDYKYIEVNDAYYSLFGFDKDEVLGKTAMELGIMTSEIRNDILLKADIQGKLTNVETDLKAKNGEIKHVMLSAEIIKLHGKNYRFTAVYDVTERKRAEKALKGSEAMLTKAQQIAHVGSWELDDTTHELHWSDETFRIFGFAPRSVVPTMELFLKCIHPDDLAFLNEAITSAWNSLASFNEDHRIILPDGQIRMVHEQAEIKFDDAGRPEMWMGIVQDITEVKKAEDELKNSIEQLHFLTQYIENVRENERVAISRELHDDLGQALTAVKIDLGTIKQSVADMGIISKINKVSALVGETIKTVQNITSQLRPPIIDDLGIEAAIEWYTKEFEQRNGVKVIFKSDSMLTISPDASLNIFRIMQESLTNIARHSKASKVELVLNKNDESINFRISDNGIGINESKIKSIKSFGIISMKERAASIGGTFTIHRNKKRGTAIELILPLT